MTGQVACPRCGPANPLVRACGHVGGWIPVRDGDLVCWHPCPACRPDAYAAWAGGYLRDTDRRNAETRARETRERETREAGDAA